MFDSKKCPICQQNTKNLSLDYSYQLNLHGNFIERTCSYARNHSLQFIADKKTKKILSIIFSLDFKYSKFISVNFVQSCSFLILPSQTIKFPYLLLPDFPSLDNLNKKINLLLPIV